MYIDTSEENIPWHFFRVFFHHEKAIDGFIKNR